MAQERAIRLVRKAPEQEPDVSFNQTRWSRASAGCGRELGHAALLVQAGRLRRAGQAPGTTTAAPVKIGELEREVRELKRANEILLATSGLRPRSGKWSGASDPHVLVLHRQLCDDELSSIVDLGNNVLVVFVAHMM